MSKARDLANLISGGFTEADVPALSASKITSGTFADARLSSSSVTQHVDLTSLSASNLTSGTVPDARLSASSVTQHVDLSNLNASNLTSGTVPNARYGTPTFSAANLTDISATPLAPTTGTWTPSFSHGSWSNITGKYQKFGRLVFCQAEMQNTAYTPDDSSINITFGGLPFTSQSYAGGGGYNNNWFVGFGTLYNGNFTAPKLYVKDNSTVWGIASTSSGEQSWRLTQYYNTNSKGAMKSTSFRGFRSGTTDKEWGFMELIYLAAS